jgi:biopolymer transport protein ExbD
MKFRRKDRLKIRASADITPLIDVIFQLLIFFMLSATFVVQTSINIQLPEAEGVQEIESRDITITLRYDENDPAGDGQIFVDDVEVGLDGLPGHVATLLEEQEIGFVLIRPDTRVQTGRLVRVFGYLNSLGVTNYGIAATLPAENSAR